MRGRSPSVRMRILGVGRMASNTMGPPKLVMSSNANRAELPKLGLSSLDEWTMHWWTRTMIGKRANRNLIAAANKRTLPYSTSTLSPILRNSSKMWRKGVEDGLKCPLNLWTSFKCCPLGRVGQGRRELLGPPSAVEGENICTQGIVMPQDLNKDKRQISHIQRQKYKCKYEEKYM